MDLMRRFWAWVSRLWRGRRHKRVMHDAISAVVSAVSDYPSFTDQQELEAAPEVHFVRDTFEPRMAAPLPPPKPREMVCPSCDRTVTAWRTYASGLRFCIQCAEKVDHA